MSICDSSSPKQGSSIALVLFIPSLPLYAAVLITALDVLVVLIFLDPSRSQGKPAKLFELFIIALVSSLTYRRSMASSLYPPGVGQVVTVLVSFVILIVKLNPVWVEVFKGYLPSKTIGQSSNALYTSIGIVGATVMPHALFLGSSLATQNRDGQSFLLPNLMTIQDDEQDDGQESTLHPHPNQVPRKSVGRWLASLVSAERIKDNLEEDTMIDRYRFVKTHLTNATVDIGE
jgi:Mn2+/Fe2+ NRAMP family transporter